MSMDIGYLFHDLHLERQVITITYFSVISLHYKYTDNIAFFRIHIISLYLVVDSADAFKCWVFIVLLLFKLSLFSSRKSVNIQYRSNVKYKLFV